MDPRINLITLGVADLERSTAFYEKLELPCDRSFEGVRFFFAACVALNTKKITLEQAIVSRRLTPGQWTYSPDIMRQEDLLKQSKHQFQQEHEPRSGREVIWVIKLLLATT